MAKSSDQVGRPTSAAQGVATRKAILEAAIALIAEVGWGQVTTRAIAARAGVPHGAVGYHFNGKTELLREAAISAMLQALADPLALAREAGSVRELLDGTFAWYAAGGLSDPSVALLLEAAREATRDDALREPIATELRAYRTALGDLVRADQERGLINAEASAQGTAAVIAALMDGLLLHFILDPEIDVQVTASAVQTLLEGRR